MANANKPFGLRPVKSLNGAPVNMQIEKFYVPATDSTAFYVGDTVKLAGTEGSLYAGDPPLPTVTKAATGDAVVGVCVGIEPLYSDLTTRYRKASTGMYVFVVTDPNTVFEIQGDSDTYAAADVGLNMSITVSTGSATTGVSNAVADQSTAAATSTLALQVLGTVPAPDNDLTGGYPRLLVKLNNHQYSNATTGL
jgi:hypothetical protein